MLVASNAVARSREDEARAAIADARRVHPNPSIDIIQRAYGVSRPEVDARRSAAL